MQPSLRIHTHPSRRVKRIPVGMITESGEIVGEDGGILYCDHSAYALRHARKYGGTGIMVYTSGSTRWVRFNIRGTDVFPGTACRDVEQLIAFRDYCFGIGIHADSIPSMASCIMRNTLPGAFDVSRGEGIPFHHFPNGARIHAVPGVHRKMIQSDITAAYLWGLGSFTPARDFHYTRKCSAQTVADNPGSFAVVEFRAHTEQLWGAMPQVGDEGVTVYPEIFGDERICATLSSFDIECGMHAGYEMKVRRAWLANPTVGKPFSAFMWEIWDMRENSAFPDIAKQAGNTMWGSFCANPRTALVKFPGDDRRPRIQYLPPRDPMCLPIGYSVAARLRSRLYIDTVGKGAVQAHTDGIVSYWGRSDPNRSPGTWRIADVFDEVEVLSGSWYRTRKFGVDTYKLAGRHDSGERAAKLFDNQRERLRI